MKTWKQMINDVIRQKRQRGWDKLFWCIDLHGVIIDGRYNKYNEGSSVYPYAKETLDYLYNNESYVTILWTSSYKESIVDVLKKYSLNFNYINENPMCPSDELCDFGKKFYFNILLDDKSGFDPEFDWKEIYDCLMYKERHNYD